MLERVPEPELMDSTEQVAAYAGADFAESDNAFVARLLQSMQPVAATGRLIDLGCGPAGISIGVARELPGWQVTALDAGSNMLASAHNNLRSEPATVRERMTLHQALLPEHGLEQQFDVVISNSLLHHLPDPATLWQSMLTLGRSGARVQVMDLLRPHSEQQLQQLVQTHAADAPIVLQQDFSHSLRAAYTLGELAAQLHLAGLQQLQVVQISDRHVQVSGTL
jgi:2-polyprenyl-3-methyl-5-hydroxy-6-metoxy-1,4-benzoquinol methylase